MKKQLKFFESFYEKQLKFLWNFMKNQLSFVKDFYVKSYVKFFERFFMYNQNFFVKQACEKAIS